MKNRTYPKEYNNAEFVDDAVAPDGQYGPRVALDFLVYYDKNREPVKLGRVFGKKLTPKSKLWEALSALGAKLEFGKPFDTKTLIGAFCRVMVEDYTDDSDGKTVSGIQKIKEPNGDTAGFIASVKANMRKSETKAVEPDPVPIETIENLN